MPGRRDEMTNQRIFDSVQEFWSSEVVGRHPASVQHGNFVGQVLKGIVDEDRLRELRTEDVESGRRPDTLIVSQVLNLDRNWNWDRLDKPPPRTGQFFTFMDEVEEVATRTGCRQVVVEKVATGFLPEKLENRGYRKVDDPHGFPNPNYVKVLPRGNECG